ncbi:MAG TPA: class I SAM-dependent methyltransferase [Actinomycetota bacterium]|nr:class I SAM-dependent methyltransferase [Actinomycetota bacterium]
MDAQGWDERYGDAELVWSGEPNRFVAQHLAGLTPGDAVDLGAGEGRNAVWLAGRGWRVTAVDFSAVGLEKARRMAFEADVELATVVGDVETYEPPFPVDLVLISYLQIPDVHQMSLLRRVKGWLNPAGVVFVVAHDKANVERGHGGPQDVGVCYEVEQTVTALDGLRIEVAEVAARPVDDAVALDTVVLARRA